MTGDELLEDNHVVRYIKPRLFNDGEISAEAFQLRENESDGLSVNWLECFEDLTKSEQLDEVRRLIQMRITKKGRFAELLIGKTKQHLAEKLNEVRFIHKPSPAMDNYKADPSHSEVEGLPPWQESQEGFVVGAFIAAHCVKNIFPGVR